MGLKKFLILFTETLLSMMLLLPLNILPNLINHRFTD